MLGGWKPKKSIKPKYFNIFTIRYDDEIVDQLIKELVRNELKYKEAVIYLGMLTFMIGPRKSTTYALH